MNIARAIVEQISDAIITFFIAGVVIGAVIGGAILLFIQKGVSP